MAIKKLKKVEKCSYCGKESSELIKVGPDLRFCNYENCYAKNCLKNHPGTPLADIIAKAYPNAVSEKSVI